MICQQFELSEKRIFILDWFGKHNWSPLGRMIDVANLGELKCLQLYHRFSVIPSNA